MPPQNQRKNNTWPSSLGTQTAQDEDEDERFMRLALHEAAKGIGHTSPNPAVGAVIVKNGRVLARGYHHAAGQPHAEIEALRALKSPAQARGATIYVTLEPCSTHGRTPPCTEAILQAGLARVVIGAMDPNPQHVGRGNIFLEIGGLSVRKGVLAEECRQLNAAFSKWIVSGKPWVIAKAALTLDGRLTRPPSEGQWLSGPAALAHAHRLRARVDAVLIGAGTLRADNPRLTVRGASGAETRQPWRVVLAGNQDLSTAVHLFTDEWKERTLVYRDQSLRDVLAELGRRQVVSVLIEGGGQVLGQAFNADLVDEAQFYLTPLIGGGPITLAGEDKSILAKLGSARYERLGPDILLTGLVQNRV